MLSYGNMLMVQGAPVYPDGSGPVLPDLALDQYPSELSEILIPELDTKYGMLSCDKINLNAPVYYGDSEADLEKGAGQFPAGILPGQGKPVMISGHDGTFFAPLEDIRIGDIVKISTGYGVFNYKVTEKLTADANDISAYDLTQDKEQLILYTCYPFGQLVGNRSKRFFVYCDRMYNTEDTEH
jgi:sortase A